MNPLTEGKRYRLGYDYFATGFTGVQLAEAYYRLVADKRLERLLFETATMAEIDEVYNPDSEDENERMTTEELILEAIRVQRFARTDTKMAALVRVLNTHMKDKGIEAMAPIIGTPKKTGLFAMVTVQIPFSDGQVVSIVFHSPDGNKMKIAADDEIIAFRWLLNKRDITHVVSPENDAEVSLQEIGKRITQLVEKNSARFQVMQKELVEQRKTMEELKAKAEEAGVQQSERMAALQETQDAAEMIDTQIANLQGQIAKQKEFNEDLQAKIDALKAQQAANAGKATVGETPADEAKMKEEQERAAYEEKRAALGSELAGRGFVDNRMGGVWNKKDFGYVQALGVDEYSIVVGLADGSKKTFYSPTVAGFNKQATKALAFIDKKLAETKRAKEVRQREEPWMLPVEAVKAMSDDEYLKIRDKLEDENYHSEAMVLWAKRVGTPEDVAEAEDILTAHEQAGELTSALWTRRNALQDKLNDAEAAAKFLKEREERSKMVDETNRLIDVGTAAVPGIRLEAAEEAGKLWEMKEQGKLSQEAWNKYVADLKATGRVAKPEPLATPPAVSVLNDILAGKYDGDSAALGDALDQAAADLEKEGLLAQYDGLLNQAADHLTERLKKEAA